MDITLVSTLAGFAVTSIGGAYLVKRKLEKKGQSPEGVAAAEVRAKAQQMARRPTFFLDDTKRQSLQPGNKHVFPEGWEQIAPLTPKQIDRAKQKSAKELPRVSPDLQTDFEHKFYGSILSVGEKTLISNLSQGHHIFEIVQSQAYIDGKPLALSESDFEYVKRLLRAAK